MDPHPLTADKGQILLPINRRQGTDLNVRKVPQNLMLIHIEFMSGNPFQLIAHYSAADADINISAGLCHRGQEAGAGDWGLGPLASSDSQDTQTSAAGTTAAKAARSGQYSVVIFLPLSKIA